MEESAGCSGLAAMELAGEVAASTWLQKGRVAGAWTIDRNFDHTRRHGLCVNNLVFPAFLLPSSLAPSP